MELFGDFLKFNLSLYKTELTSRTLTALGIVLNYFYLTFKLISFKGVAKDEEFPIIFYDMVPYDKAPTLSYHDRRLWVAERWRISAQEGEGYDRCLRI